MAECMASCAESTGSDRLGIIRERRQMAASLLSQAQQLRLEKHVSSKYMAPSVMLLPFVRGYVLLEVSGVCITAGQGSPAIGEKDKS